MKNKHYSLWLLPLLLFFQSGEPLIQQRSTTNYALFFAVSDYELGNGLGDLQNPVRNAREIAKELREKYNFQTEIVENPKLVDIRNTFKVYQKKFRRGGGFDSKGQLLIFFSGHGIERDDLGFFMPADGDPDDPFFTAISYDLWRNRIDALNCQHILVAVDACHSAHFDPNFEDRPDKDFKRSGELSETEKILEDHKKYKARFFFTSDGEGEETPDRSNFAKKFLEAFRTNNSIDGFMTSSVLFANYLKRASPRPRGGSFGEDEAGAHFLFFEKAKPAIDTRSYTQKATDLNAWKKAQGTHTIEAYDQYLQSQINGSFRRQAEEAIRILADDIDWEIAKAQDTKAAYKLYLRQHPNGQYVQQANSKINSQTTTSRIPSNNKMDLSEMVFVQGGTFQMGDQFGDGDSNEQPVHSVTVSDFYISNHEVTNAELVEFLNDQGNQKVGGTEWYEIGDYNRIKESTGRFSVESGYENHATMEISWYGAVAYCNWKSEQSGLEKVYTMNGSNVRANWSANGYRLPTEVEWEYAARSRGKKEKWAGTSTESELSKYSNDSGTDDGYEYTAPVKSFRSNNLGLYDMSGNVWEWCWDWYDSDYYASSKDARDPRGPSTGSNRVSRGGGWYDTPRGCRAANRDYYVPTYRNDYVGFRLASSSR